MHGWQANLKRTCASPVTFRVLPENEIPPVLRVDFYFIIILCLFKPVFTCRNVNRHGNGKLERVKVLGIDAKSGALMVEASKGEIVRITTRGGVEMPKKIRMPKRIV